MRKQFQRIADISYQKNFFNFIFLWSKNLSSIKNFVIFNQDTVLTKKNILKFQCNEMMVWKNEINCTVLEAYDFCYISSIIMFLKYIMTLVIILKRLLIIQYK